MTKLGCIGCPMQNRTQEEELNRYPVYRQNYIKAFDRMIARRKADGIPTLEWKDGEDVMQWWLGKKGKEKPLEGQVKMDELTGG